MASEADPEFPWTSSQADFSLLADVRLLLEDSQPSEGTGAPDLRDFETLIYSLICYSKA